MGKQKAPDADPRIGQAAIMGAKLGRDYLRHMRKQSAVTNRWAAQDRNRYRNVFQPLQNQYIKDAKAWASPERMATRTQAVQADVQTQIGLANQQQQRQQAAMGVSPDSGRAAETDARMAVASGLAMAGAANNERRAVRAEADVRQANAINMGSGLAVNPGTSMGISNGAISNGFQGAMQGQANMASGLTGLHDAQMETWKQNQAQMGGLMSGIGSAIGMISDEDKKEGKRKPGRSLLKAVENMPVEEWSYKDGVADGGRHVGTYAQDFKRETGVGDGRSINIVDAIGTTMGAIKELSAKVDAMARPKARSVI